MVAETEKVYPIEASRQGDNTDLVSCEHYNASRHYAVCIRVIERHEEGGSRSIDRVCHAAINRNDCPAQKMRAQELEAGRALYYTPRGSDRLIVHGQDFGQRTYPVHHQGYDRAWCRTDRILRGQPARTPMPEDKERPKAAASKRASKPKLGANLHGELVNKLIKEEK